MRIDMAMKRTLPSSVIIHNDVARGEMISMQWQTSCKGEVITCMTPDVMLSISSYSNYWRFVEFDELSIWTSRYEEPIRAGVPYKNNDILFADMHATRIKETMVWSLSANDMRRVAGADVVEFKIGRESFVARAEAMDHVHRLLDATTGADVHSNDR